MEKQCKKCGSTFIKNKKFSKTQWDIQIFCSRECSSLVRIGFVPTDETKKKQSLAHKGTKKPWSGKYKHSKEHNQNISKALAELNKTEKGKSIRERVAQKTRGRKMTAETRSRLENSKVWTKGTENKGWKGMDASYSAKHKHLTRYFEKTGICTHCSKQSKTEWANKTGLYLREIDDYMELCKSCHNIYDRKK